MKTAAVPESVPNADSGEKIRGGTDENRTEIKEIAAGMQKSAEETAGIHERHTGTRSRQSRMRSAEI